MISVVWRLLMLSIDNTSSSCQKGNDDHDDYFVHCSSSCDAVVRILYNTCTVVREEYCAGDEYRNHQGLPIVTGAAWSIVRQKR